MKNVSVKVVSGKPSTITTLSAETRAAGKAVGESHSNDLARHATYAKALYADGVRPEMLVRPSKGSDTPEDNPHFKLQSMIRADLIAGFAPEVQAVIPKENSALSPVDRNLKDYWLKQVASLFGKVRNHVSKLEDKEKNPPKLKTKLQILSEDHVKQIGKARKLKPEQLPAGFSITEYVKDMSALYAKYFK